MIIFLDIDGVLNTINYIYSSQLNGIVIEKAQIALLNKIMSTFNDANIVITSSRRDDMDKLIYELFMCGFEYKKRIIDATEINGKKRGEQIQDYIGKNKISSYIVVDDEVGGICGIDGKFIDSSLVFKIDPNLGLTIYDYEKIVLHMNKTG